MNSIKLLFLGDVYTGESDIYICPEVKSIASSADLVIANLESPLTSSGNPLGGKNLYLKSKPSNIKVLEELSVDVVSLANNHICDWGVKGLHNTLDTLSNSGVLSVGAGKNLGQATKSLVLERNGYKIGILAFGDENIQTKRATPDSFGCAVLDENQIGDSIKKLRSNVDIVILQLHWGYTNYHYPLPEQIKLGRHLIEAGANIIVGHHPHVIQGYERYLSGVIVYSLGNFIFGDYSRGGKTIPTGTENLMGMICIVKFEESALSFVDFVYTKQVNEDKCIKIVSERIARKRKRFLQKLSNPLSQKKYHHFFRRYCLRRIIFRTLRWLNPEQWKYFHTDYLAGLKVAFHRIFLSDKR